MKREFLKTGDGSYTIHLPDWNEQYHSKHGAIAEAKHVFIETGLKFFFSEKEVDTISILEIGFGTGLNTYLTLNEAKKHKINIDYVGSEAYPVSSSEIEQLNYPELIDGDKNVFQQLHEVSWDSSNMITPNFSLTKRHEFFKDISDSDKFDIIYFDAFGPRVQPELWTEEIFQKMFEALKRDGVLVTYSAKGSVRRAMQAVGFEVERLPGPPGKREMLRAVKSTNDQ